ncbi:hypothetical protein DUNSADRAFT_7033 [Dunaliella salina]|uniref:Encoded protein n=1 Tax=Dunaliella salina TaxID=3046 RepID=A0ABQ7GM43_DUNSA|nr:hypothetical protein DUNSADRAFT_7033 [Dunaliella salina]|eukprot:KAF5835673.1 hypothetical protein DUNSADRAFT_7033 [Dunaliella salina]
MRAHTPQVVEGDFEAQRAGAGLPVPIHLAGGQYAIWEGRFGACNAGLKLCCEPPAGYQEPKCHIIQLSMCFHAAISGRSSMPYGRGNFGPAALASNSAVSLRQGTSNPSATSYSYPCVLMQQSLFIWRGGSMPSGRGDLGPATLASNSEASPLQRNSKQYAANLMRRGRGSCCTSRRSFGLQACMR